MAPLQALSSAMLAVAALLRPTATTIDFLKQWIEHETKGSCAQRLARQRKRSVRPALIPPLARFWSSAIESCREDIIAGPAAITLRLNAFAILVRHCPPEPRFTLRWNRAPQKDALLRAQMRYS